MSQCRAVPSLTEAALFIAPRTFLLDAAAKHMHSIRQVTHVASLSRDVDSDVIKDGVCPPGVAVTHTRGADGHVNGSGWRSAEVEPGSWVMLDQTVVGETKDKVISLLTATICKDMYNLYNLEPLFLYAVMCRILTDTCIHLHFEYTHIKSLWWILTSSQQWRHHYP